MLEETGGNVANVVEAIGWCVGVAVAINHSCVEKYISKKCVSVEVTWRAASTFRWYCMAVCCDIGCDMMCTMRVFTNTVDSI